MVLSWRSRAKSTSRREIGHALHGIPCPNDCSDPSSPQSARVGRDDRPCHGRQQSDDLHHRGAFRWPGRHPGPRERGGAVAHVRRAARLGRGTRLDRTRPDVAEPRRRHLRRLRRGVPPLQSGPRLAHRHLLLVGLDSDLWPDRTPFGSRLPALVLPHPAGRSCCNRHRLLFHLHQSLWDRLGRTFCYPDRHGLGHACVSFRP